MTEVPPVGPASPTAADARTKSEAATPPAAAQNRGQDEVQLSDLAKLKSKLRDLPDIREDLIRTVKRQIADNTYVTDERLDVAADKMIDEFLGR